MKAHGGYAIAIALLGAATAVAQAPSRRPMVADDLFGIQTLGEARISPDGGSIAIVIQRAWSDPERYYPYTMFGNDRADIWILPADGGPARNITRGAADGSGYSTPVWSPDGQRLALLSTAGGDNVRAYMWDRNSGRLQRLSERGVELSARMDATASGDFSSLAWVDNRRLLVMAVPEGEQPVQFRLRRQTARIASDAWKKAAQGQQPTASILESGIPPRAERAVQLLSIDVQTRRTQVLAEGGIRYVALSPDREHVAVFAQGRPPVPAAGQLRAGVRAAPTRLGIVSLREGSAVRWIEGLFNPEVGFGGHPHRWSSKGSSLAVIAADRAESGSRNAVFVVSAADRSVTRVASNLVASAAAWSEDDQLLVRARAAGAGDRADWWIVPPAPAAPRNLTAALSAIPAQLLRTRRANEMIGLADGTLYAFDLAAGGHRPLIEPSGPRVSAMVWPGEDERLTASLSSAVVRTREGDVESLLRIDFESSDAPRASRFPQPDKATTLAAFYPGRNLAVFAAPQDPDGTFLWTGAGGSSGYTQRIALNQQLAAIATGERMLVDYRSTDGQELKGMLLLPAGYQRGVRYPLLTWVYPGYVIRSIASASDWMVKNHAHMDNLHVFSGAGYAVLMPSIPGDRTRDELLRGVLPAVDRVVELGIADPERVAVAGQSGGGFVTYSLITQTTRFKAAIAISGPADNFTSYGVFSGESRYADDVDEIVTGGAAGRYGTPPWKDPDQYLRNSPTTFLDRVETPLLILHGDIDFVPIQHAEQVFTSLAQQGKRVRFVRYWGESHGAGDSPANVRDRWRQMLGWLDAYLRPQ